LFGFVSPGRCGSDINEQRLLLDAISQLADLFGPQAAEPVRVHLVNWASEPETATPLDTADLAGHPRYREIGLASDPWAGRLLFSGTETAPENGGFLEGALEAAERVAGVLA
jgi:monoamine oxidase